MANKDSLFNINPWIAFGLMVLIFVLVIYIKHEVVISDQILINEFSGDDFEAYLDATNKFRLVKYLFLTISFAATILLTYALVRTANSVFGLDISDRFLLNCSTFASSMAILKELIICAWFVFKGSFISSELFNFYPLSLFAVLGTENTRFPSSYILQSLDLFFLLKVAFIIACLIRLSIKKTGYAVKAVLTVYLAPILFFYLILQLLAI